MVCLERDTKIEEKSEEKSSENNCERIIAKTLYIPSVAHLNPLTGPERASAAGSISLTVEIVIQIQGFHLFLMHIIA